MKLTTAFQIGTYLCLALATACLGYTERLHLAGISALYLLLGLLVLIAFLLEGRWVMPAGIANLVALVILLGWLLWFWLDLQRMLGREATLDPMAWSLPRLGPLLAVLLLAKLFRPKTAGDYWLLHGLALVQVALACALAHAMRQDREDPIFGMLLLGYVLTGIWSIALFYMYRESVAGRLDRSPAPASVRLPWLLQGWRQTLVLMAVALVVALPMFFLIPWPNQMGQVAQAASLHNQSQTGFSPIVDLNDTGQIQVSNELVMRVEAYNQRGESIDLGAGQRWRGLTCSVYERGVWKPAEVFDERRVHSQNLPAQERLQGDQLRLKFQVDLSKLGGSASFQGNGTLLFLAEPIAYSPFGMPLVALSKELANPEFVNPGPVLAYRQQETAVYSRLAPRSGPLIYHQVISHPGPPPPIQPWREPYDYRRALLRPPPSAAFGQRTKEILEQEKVPEGAEPLVVAQALERHLSDPRYYTYSLDRRRTDLKLDPTEDFLVHVRQGHCELFASALALMLRSQRIPARVVVGFRGAEWVNFPLMQFNEVRQYHAHAWVEAFVGPRSADGTIQEGRWLTFDPSPSGGTPQAFAQSRGSTWKEKLELAKYFWGLILDYNGDLQQDRLGALGASLQADWLPGEGFYEKLNSISWTLGFQGMFWGLVFLFAGGMVFYLAYGLWRRSRRGRTEDVMSRVPFYTRLLELLARLSLRPGRSQTPLEFGTQAEQVLLCRPETAALAGIPTSVVAGFYDVRYGGHSLDDGRAQAIYQDLDRLEENLPGRVRPAKR